MCRRPVYTADFAQFDRETAKAAQTVDKFTKETAKSAQELTKLTTAFNGGPIIQQAQQIATAITAVGGATKLTAAEQIKANATLQEAVAKYQALGQTAPASISKLAGEMKTLVAANEKAARSAKDLEGQQSLVAGAGTKLGAVLSGVVAGGVAAVGTAAIAATTALLRMAVEGFGELVARGAQVSSLQAGFTSLAGGVAAADKIMAAMRGPSKGLVADMDLVGPANKAMLLGVTKNAEEFAKLTTTATTLGRALGQDTTKSIDDLITALGRSSPMILDNLGLTVSVEKANEAYAAALNKTAAELTDAEKKQAFMNAAMAAAEKRVTELGDVQLTFSDRLKTVQVAAKNLFDAIAEGVAKSPALNAAMETIGGTLSTAFGSSQETLIKNIVAAVNKATLIFLEFGKAALDVAAGIVRAWNAIEPAILRVAMAGARSMQVISALKLDKEAAGSWGKFADEIGRVLPAAEKAATSGISPLTSAIDKARSTLVAASAAATAAISADANLGQSATRLHAAYRSGELDIRRIYGRTEQIKPATEAHAAATTAAAAATSQHTAKTKEAEAAAKKAAAAQKAYQTELDKLTGKDTVDNARKLVEQIAAVGGASQVSAAQAAASTDIINAGIKTLVEKGQEVPPIWREVAVELQIVSGKTEGLYPPLEKARQVTQALAESFGATVRTSTGSKIVPPPITVPGLEPFKGVPPGVTSHPDWLEDSAAAKGLLAGLFGDPSQFGQQITSTIIGAVQGGGKVGASVGAGLGGSIAGGLAKNFAPAITKALGSTLGSVVGGAMGPLGAIAGQLLGGVFDKIFGPSQKEKTKQARDEWIASAGGLEKIEEAAKRANVSVDGLMKASKEKTLTAETKKFEEALKKADDRIKKTTESLAKLSAEGGLIGKDLVASMKGDIDQKDLQAALAQFQSAQTEKAVGGIGTFLKTTTLETTAGVEAVGASLAALFGSLQQQGLSAAQALTVLDEPIGAFQARLEQMGITAPAAFGELARLASIAGGTITGPLLEGVTGLGSALEGLHNTGLLTGEMFAGLAGEVGATFAKLQDQGVGGSNAIKLMQKPLQTIWELQQKYGYEVDEATQGVIDLAYAGGSIGEQFLPAADRIAASIETLITKLDSLFTGMVTGATEGAQGAKTAIERGLGGIRVPTIEVPIVARYEGFDDIPTPQASVSPAAASSIGPTSMTVSTYLDGEVIAQNQMPHLARELTLLGV